MRRLRAAALALVFFGGGTSLPSLDVLLFHMHGERTRGTAHIEPAGGCGSHANHCRISCPAGSANALGAQAAAPLLDVSTPPSRARPRFYVPAKQAQAPGFLSRAPPVART